MEENRVLYNSTEEQYASRQASRSGPSGLSQFAIQLGIAKDEAQAASILLGLAVVAALVSGYFFIGLFASTAQPRIPLEVQNNTLHMAPPTGP